VRDRAPQIDAQRLDIVQRIGAVADRGMGHQDDVAVAVAQQRLGRVARLGIEHVEPQSAEAAGRQRRDEGSSTCRSRSFIGSNFLHINVGSQTGWHSKLPPCKRVRSINHYGFFCLTSFGG
jgi:hypothetical protein